MSNLLHPVGPERPAVYWRRRIILLLALVAVVVLVVALTGGGKADAGGQDRAASLAAATDPAPAATGAPEATAQPTDRATDQPSLEPTEDPTAGPEEQDETSAPSATCEPAVLDVSVATDAVSYAPEATPRFTVTAMNSGDDPCSLDVGTSDAVELVLTSGDDRVWSSDDCQEAAEERIVTLASGEHEQQSVSWQRTRSAKGCPGNPGTPRPGTYQLTARVGEVTSEPVTFRLD